MANQYPQMLPMHQDFIRQQPLFFVATAAATGRVNVSPKGMDSLRILDPNRVAWLSVTGSGNETAAHILQTPRMTLMFCAFEGRPLILRLYGSATAVYPKDAAWNEYIALFHALPGTRQIFVLDVELVQTSCGMAVPYMDYVGEREALNAWAERKGEAGLEAYWQEKNSRSIDGFETGMAGGVSRAPSKTVTD